MLVVHSFIRQLAVSAADGRDLSQLNDEADKQNAAMEASMQANKDNIKHIQAQKQQLQEAMQQRQKQQQKKETEMERVKGRSVLISSSHAHEAHNRA